MTEVSTPLTVPFPLERGCQCLLHVLGQHFLVDVLRTEEETIHISFPGQDYPVSGMKVHIEYHDANGYDIYPVEVLRGRESSDNGIVLAKPQECQRIQHRRSFRAPTDLTVQIKDTAHVRRYDAALRNIGSGGALVETEAPFEVDTQVELTVSLPGEPTHIILGSVINALSNEVHGQAPKYRYRIRFVSPASPAVQSVSRYIWQRLRELYPAS